jgi:hypothetical protein
MDNQQKPEERLAASMVEPGVTARTGGGAVDDAVPARWRFPAVRGRTLLGLEVTLPGDLPADRTLVVVAFQRWHQARVDGWIARAVAGGVPPTTRGQTGQIPVAVVEVPVLSTRWRPVRRFIDGGMTAGIGDPDVLARTITVYADVAAFRGSLGIPDGDDVHALVVTRDGAILARASGESEAASWAAIESALVGSVSGAT